MDNALQYVWVDFYKELAQKLLQFKNDRATLIENVKRIYETTGINLPTLERDNAIVDIDPFTVFGLFNKSSMKQSNREKIISAVADIFGVQAAVPTSFESIPLLNNQNATFYYFVGDREENDIDDLWNMFESALTYAENPSAETRAVLSHYFDLTIGKKGNGNSKITMGLYWIAPDAFLNLDQRNRWYIYDSGKMPAELIQTLPAVESRIPSSKYFDIVEKLRAYLQSPASPFKDFVELSAEAWRYSEEVNEAKRQEKANQDHESKSSIGDDDVDSVHYWIYSPGDNASIWDECYNEGVIAIGWDKIGDLRDYQSKDEMRQAMKTLIDPNYSWKNGAHATWQFVNEMKPGDIVFAKKGMHLVIGRGVVESEYEFDASRSHYKNIRRVKWTHKGEWEHPGQAVMKTLTNITPYTDYVEKLNALFESDIVDDEEEHEVKYSSYSASDFLKEVYMDEDRYKTLVSLVETKKNVILQGAPGVGKTFTAKRLAYSIIGVKDPNRVMMVQFHQSYSYEDFIMGFRPSEKGFELKHGAFYKFCKKAEADIENPYFFIIDEINRGNLSKIFGELFMLIENDKRDTPLRLLYSDELFAVPRNVRIIGMMNTADRSLAMLDYALRRRFAFFELKPGFDTEGFRNYKEGLANEKFDRLINCVINLNNVIATDESLGEGFCIGHSYFSEIKEVTDQKLSNIVEFELIPLLKEYWFDEPAKVRDWANSLRSAIK